MDFFSSFCLFERWHFRIRFPLEPFFFIFFNFSSIQTKNFGQFWALLIHFTLNCFCNFLFICCCYQRVTTKEDKWCGLNDYIMAYSVVYWYCLNSQLQITPWRLLSRHSVSNYDIYGGPKVRAKSLRKRNDSRAGKCLEFKKLGHFRGRVGSKMP